jgi:hypothetical protein
MGHDTGVLTKFVNGYHTTSELVSGTTDTGIIDSTRSKVLVPAEPKGGRRQSRSSEMTSKSLTK